MGEIKLFEGRKMVDHDTIMGVTVASIPSAIWLFVREFLNVPVEKWVSRATLVLIVLQVIFLLRRELKKRSDNRKTKYAR